MNRFKKAISVGMSATLLASLFTVIAASSAIGAVTVTSAGNVPQNGTSAGPATFVLTEQAIASLVGNAPGSVSITIAPAAPGVGTVTFSGTPVVSAPGSLGASASVIGSVLTVAWTNTDVLNIESITITGLKIDASATATPGAITATLAAVSGNGTVAAFQAGGTASGTLSAGIGIGATTATVAVTTAGCPFVTTGTAGSGTFDFATNPQSVAGTAGALAAGSQTLSAFVPATTVGHLANEVVTQTNACGASGVLASPGIVVQALVYADPPTKPSVFPGENNSPAANLVITEPVAGFLALNSTFTYTIATAGVVFSSAPAVAGTGATGGTITGNTVAAATVVTTAAAHGLVTGNSVVITGSNSVPLINGTFTVTALSATTFSIPVTVTTAGTAGTVVGPPLAGGIGLSAAVLAPDRKSATVTVSAVSAVPATITLSGILYDVAATVPGGTFVSVGITTSGAKAVNPPARNNAVVFRGIAAVSATTPTVYIGENNQVAGIVSFTEAAAGFFTDGTGSNNTFTICPKGVTYVFTLAPSAKVTGGIAAGNLILREGAVASPDNVVPGTLTNVPVAGCYSWTVWTKSTTASTIQIGNVDVTTGALINVNVNQAPGAVLVELYIGNAALATQLAATVQFATAAFRNQVSVTALSQPTIPVGSNGSAAGDIQIQETALGQLKATEEICVEVLPNQNAGTLYDAFFKGLTTADVPVVTATNGVVTGPVTFSNSNCTDTLGSNPGTFAHSFAFIVLQQSTTGTGKLVISNIKFATVNDAVAGPVQVNVYGIGKAPTTVVFQTLISNARIGSAIGGSAATRLGVTQTGAFTISTKVTTVRKYVTYRFDFGVGAAGAHLQIWGATKTGNDWSAFTAVTSRVANASGVVYYYIRQNSATWKSYRASWIGGGTLTPARQARWK